MTAFQRVAPVLSVHDVRVALIHYRKLGFKADAYEGDGVESPVYGFCSWGPVELHLARFTELDPRINTAACYLYVDDAPALHAAWTSAGVAGRFTPLEDTPYGLREFDHVDPDGNLLRVGSPLPT